MVEWNEKPQKLIYPTGIFWILSFPFCPSNLGSALTPFLWLPVRRFFKLVANFWVFAALFRLDSEWAFAHEGMGNLGRFTGKLFWGILFSLSLGTPFLVKIFHESTFLPLWVWMSGLLFQHVPLNRLGSLEKESHPKAAKPKSVQVDPGHRSGWYSWMFECGFKVMKLVL